MIHAVTAVAVMWCAGGAAATEKGTADDMSGDLTTARARYVALLAPRDLDVKDAAVRRMLARRDKAAERLMKGQIMTAGAKGFGSWGRTKGRRSEDLNSSGSYFGRVYRLADAYASPHSKHHRSKTVLAHVTAALEYVEPFVRAGGPHPGNWWAWDIGIPMRLGDTIILLGDDLPEATREKMVAALLGLVKRRYHLGYRHGGANVLWVAFNQLRVAMITGREDYARSAAAIFGKVSAVGRGLGIQKDYSYHFHGRGLNMGYGRAQFDDVSRYIHVTGGTGLGMPASARRAHEDWFANFIVFNSYRGRVSPFTVGRSISRPGAVVSTGDLEAAMLLALADGGAHKDLLAAFIREWFDARPDDRSRTPTIASLAPRVAPMLEKAGAVPAGARFYPLSDYLACRQPWFYVSVRMSSVRTKAWFSIRNENNHAACTGDGALTLMTDGGELDEAVIPTMDWYALSGVTSAYGMRQSAERAAQSKIVGGLAHGGTVGAAGMHFVIERNGRRLDARKSVTVFPDAVVLLGSGIALSEAPKKGSVVTALHQCPLRAADKQALIDGKAMDLADGSHPVTAQRLRIRNFTYLFPEPTAVDLRVTTTTRDYGYCNHHYGRLTPKEQRTAYTRRFYNLLIDHGRKPTDGGYAVVILPGAAWTGGAKTPAKDFRSPGRLRKSPVEVVARTTDAHVVRHGASGTVVAYFFAAGKAGGFEAGGPLIAAVSADGDRLRLTLQDPTHRGGKRALTVPFRLGPAEGVDVQATGGGSRITAPLRGGWPADLSLPILAGKPAGAGR